MTAYSLYFAPETVNIAPSLSHVTDDWPTFPEVKVRGMLLRKALLANIPKEEPQYESPTHATRWKTLQQLAKQYQENPQRFIEIEICL